MGLIVDLFLCRQNEDHCIFYSGGETGCSVKMPQANVMPIIAANDDHDLLFDEREDVVVFPESG